MLIWAHKMAELNFESLMQVYWEGNRDNGMRFYTHLEQDQAHKRAEQDFYNYLADDFFAHRGARYAIWAEKEQYICALRLEPWEDGLLLQALETHPDHRRRGYAKQLITAVQKATPETKIYSHVSKGNKASLAAHKSCNFQIIKDTVRLLDGTVSANSFTLCWPVK